MSSFDFDVVTGPSAARAPAEPAREAPKPQAEGAEAAEPPDIPAGRRVEAAE